MPLKGNFGATSSTSKLPNPSQFTFSLETPSLSSGTLDKYLKSVLGTDSTNAIPDLLRPPIVDQQQQHQQQSQQQQQQQQHNDQR